MNTLSKGTDRTSWTVKDTQIPAELAELMALTDDECTTLACLHDAAKAQAPAMSQAFYDRLTSHDYTNEYFQGLPMDTLHGTIRAWFSDLFAGTYDAAYVEQRLQIGRVHVRIGLPVRYPLAMLDVVTQHGEAVCNTADDPEAAKKAFHKALALDIAVFNQAYEDNQLKHLAELVGGERLARRLIMGGV
jgi:hypothetical protein